MWRQDITQEISLTSVMEPTDTGAIASPIYSSAYDMRAYAGQRFMAVLRAAASLTGAIAHGVTFSIQDSEDGSTGWADKAEVSETLAKLTAAGVQKVAF